MLFKAKHFLVLVILIHLVDLLETKRQFQIFRGLKVVPKTNLSYQIITAYENIDPEIICLTYCLEVLCTAISFNKASKTCKVNRYGRVMLESDNAFVTWVLSMLFSKIHIIQKVPLQLYTFLISKWKVGLHKKIANNNIFKRHFYRTVRRFRWRNRNSSNVGTAGSRIFAK